MRAGLNAVSFCLCFPLSAAADGAAADAGAADEVAAARAEVAVRAEAVDEAAARVEPADEVDPRAPGVRLARRAEDAAPGAHAEVADGKGVARVFAWSHAFQADGMVVRWAACWPFQRCARAADLLVLSDGPDLPLAVREPAAAFSARPERLGVRL